jgi:RES domain-containing protein
VTRRKLESDKVVYRIGDASGRFPIFSGEGSKLSDGRWHQKGQDPIYAAEHLSLAMLEKLVHLNGVFPTGQHSISITIPSRTAYEVVTPHQIPQWYDATGNAARKFGSKWFDEKRSCILIVPSVVARVENNVLINPHHSHFNAITASLEQPVTWDNRLFSP